METEEKIYTLEEAALFCLMTVSEFQMHRRQPYRPAPIREQKKNIKYTGGELVAFLKRLKELDGPRPSGAITASPATDKADPSPQTLALYTEDEVRAHMARAKGEDLLFQLAAFERALRRFLGYGEANAEPALDTTVFPYAPPGPFAGPAQIWGRGQPVYSAGKDTNQAIARDCYAAST